MTLPVALIVLLPLLGAAINGLVGLFVPAYRRQEKVIGWLAVAMVAIPFLLALGLFWNFSPDQEPVVVSFYPWLVSGDLFTEIGYQIDELSLIMMLIVTGIGAVIHVYSIGYMHGDPGFWRFFAYLNLFIFAMLNLIMANNLLLLFLGWEGVGLCSYLLIGFWYEDLAKSRAAMKAFIVNRIGDAAFLLAMFLLFRELGALDFETVLSQAHLLDTALVSWIVLLFFFGATGKSAQIPLFVWLPDAMAGPTPVSALIHAATMVTSGLYLLARLSPVVLLAPGVMMLIAVIGTLTAIMAATIAITQYDIKKVLAYSTVSQLGYMFLAAGVGAFYVSIFHVFTHAFFKALLFLGAGSVIHAMEHVGHELKHKGALPPAWDPNDMRLMGGLRKYMPDTYKTYLIATLAIAGVPPLAGFFSKDEILFRTFALGWNGETWAMILWVVGLITAVLTAIYMTRSLILTFHGHERWPHHGEVHPHESPRVMTIPLWILAIGSVLGGFVGLPNVIAHGKLNWIHHWLVEGGPVKDLELLHHVPLVLEWALLLLGAAIGIGGVYWAWKKYEAYGLGLDEILRERLGKVYTIWEHKYYWDEMYDRVVVRPLLFMASVFARFDKRVVDGIVNGVASLTQQVALTLRYLQTGVVTHYAIAVVVGVILVLSVLLFG